MESREHGGSEFEQDEGKAEGSEARRNKKGEKGKTDKPPLSESAESSSLYYWHALLLLGGRLLSKALTSYNSVVAIDPRETAKIHRNISAHYAKKGLHEKAFHHLKEWTRLEPSNPDAHYQLAVALTASGKYAAALAVLTKVLRLKPTHKGAMYRKSGIHLKLKEYDGAIEGFKEFTELYQDEAKPYCYLGIAYDHKDELEKAIEAMQKAVELDPEEMRYHQYLGFFYERQGDSAKAARCFCRAMEIEREQREEEDY